MIAKNESYQVTIEDLTLEGSGVCRIDGFAVFVPLTAPGDVARIKIVKVLKSYGFGILEALLTPSPARSEDPLGGCPVYRQCGGCTLRHIRYEAELRQKEKAVCDAFERLGGFSLRPLPIIGAPSCERYRNKAQYPLAAGPDGKIRAGFYAAHSHRVIPAEKCFLQPEIFEEICGFVLTFINGKKLPCYSEETGKGIYRNLYLRQAPGTGEILVCLVATRKRPDGIEALAKALCQRFPKIVGVCVNINAERTNVILGRKFEKIWGKMELEDLFMGVRLRISPASFYQVNGVQAATLYERAFELAGFTGKEDVLELYCGIGSIGLSGYSQMKSLTGVEIVPEAVENAKQNARLNQMERTQFYCLDASGAAARFVSEGRKPDVVLVDPPRKGCDPEVLEAIAAMGPKKVLMISCNPATAARDCARLCEQGYELCCYQPVDLFPRTGHVETICTLVKKEEKR